MRQKTLNNVKMWKIFCTEVVVVVVFVVVNAVVIVVVVVAIVVVVVVVIVVIVVLDSWWAGAGVSSGVGDTSDFNYGKSGCCFLTLSVSDGSMFLPWHCILDPRVR